MDVQERETFARAWLTSWNERDLNRIVSHYADDVEFQSPFAVHLLGDAFRTIKGKENLTRYFERVLAAVPGKIEFEFLGVFHGVDTLVVHFQSKMHKCAEFMELNHEGKVRRAMAHLRAEGL
jgi:ketosteroid isomerase-like protein